MRELLKKVSRILPDKIYLKLKYRIIFHKKLNLNCPITFNEKLQWLKINDRKKIYTSMVDKFEAKKYVSSIIGQEYIIPTLGIYNSFDEINFSLLPKEFVIKCTHDSGGLVICKDKEKLDKMKTKKIITKCLKNNYFYSGREWPYKNVKPRIIIEQYMRNKNEEKIRDYKFFCFNGKTEYMYISEGMDNHETAKMCFFDKYYNVVDIQRSDYKEFEELPQKPKNFEKMIELSNILSENIPHLRVDWYEINGKIYFGELTFFTCSGFVPFKSEEMDRKLGSFINLN